MPLRVLAMLLLAGLLAPHLGAQQAANPSKRPFDVTHYSARVEPDIATATIKGLVTVRLAPSSRQANGWSA